VETSLLSVVTVAVFNGSTWPTYDVEVWIVSEDEGGHDAFEFLPENGDHRTVSVLVVGRQHNCDTRLPLDEKV
jgi:hypothetical protein